MTTDENKAAIRACISELGAEYAKAPALILTEDDLKCHLFSKLNQRREFGGVEETSNASILGSKVHSEVSWFDSNGKLGIKPDLTILDPKNLNTEKALTEGMRLPSKQFHFVGNAFIFELKVIRSAALYDGSDRALIEDDFLKIIRLQEKLREDKAEGSVFCYFVIFSKGKIEKVEFAELIKSYQPKIPFSEIIYLHS
jgi:hypothetical protein